MSLNCPPYNVWPNSLVASQCNFILCSYFILLEKASHLLEPSLAPHTPCPVIWGSLTAPRTVWVTAIILVPFSVSILKDLKTAPKAFVLTPPFFPAECKIFSLKANTWQISVYGHSLRTIAETHSVSSLVSQLRYLHLRHSFFDGFLPDHESHSPCIFPFFLYPYSV